MSGWMQERTHLEKTLLSFSILLILTLVLLIFLGISFRGDGSKVLIGDRPNCFAKECIETAGQIISAMQEELNPCSDFYMYACGNYGKRPGQTTSVASSAVESVYSSIKYLLETAEAGDEDFNFAKSLYRTCIEFEGLQGKRPDDILRDLMTKFKVGTWPVVDTFFDVDSNLSLNDRLAELALLGVPVAFKVEVSPDYLTNSSFLLKLSPGGPQVSGRLTEDIRSDTKLRTYMLSSFLLLGAPHSRAVADADDILSVDMWYARIEQDRGRQCDTTDYLKAGESTSELNRLMPEANWTILMSSIQEATGIHERFAVELHCKEKIRDYLIYLNDLTLRSAYNYLGWRFFSAFEKYIIADYNRTQNERRENRRWKECLTLVEEHATPALVNAFLHHYIPFGTFGKIQKMITNIKTSLQNHKSLFHWWDSDQRTEFLRKVADAQLLLPNSQNESSLVLLPKVDLNNYTYVVIKLRQQSLLEKFQLLNRSLEYAEAIESRRLPITSDSIPTLNPNVRIHLDEICEPFLRIKASEWLDYGSLGTAIARKIITAVLEEKFLVNEELMDQWTSAQFSNDCLPQPSTVLGFNLTNPVERKFWLKEIFINTLSVEVAFQSVNRKVTSEHKHLAGLEKNNLQMFFVSYAQSFCEMKNDRRYVSTGERINAVLSNSEIFRESFSCNATFRTPIKCLHLI